ncbi:MAG TPA: sialidase family protein [Streptosporangiaceae bacterium]|nr:sialidase family protein [Streptosporangiaceae bacterium]
MRRRAVVLGTALSRTMVILAAGLLLGSSAPAPASVSSSGVPAVLVSQVTATCSGQNAEVQTAIDPAAQVLYEAWIGCSRKVGRSGEVPFIGFARSTDGGKTFSRGTGLPGSAFGWDPAIALGPTGKVYVAFMVSTGVRTYPVIDISANHGRTFPMARSLIPPRQGNWGDRDFIAVGPHGEIYLTWDYGPVNDIFFNPPVQGGSASFAAGDVNAVVQRSTDDGKTWSKIIPISPGFPTSGADSAPVLVEPDGRIDVLYQGYQVLNRKTLKFGVAHSYFTTSTDHGLKWSKPIRIGPARLSMNTTGWWIDGSLGIDTAGNLYTTWDTQSGGHDIGWLAYSTTKGRAWSRLIRVTPDTDNALHLVQVTGGARRTAYVGWLTNAPARGYAPYLRVFSISKGWLTPVIRVAATLGNRYVWPGDTIGLSLFPGGTGRGHAIAVSWGSAHGSRKAPSEIWALVVTHLP